MITDLLGISWLLIYRHKDYQTLVLNIESLSKKIDKTKDTQLYTGATAKNKTQEKKLVYSENLLKQY
jgi:hypothetical protein